MFAVLGIIDKFSQFKKVKSYEPLYIKKIYETAY